MATGNREKLIRLAGTAIFAALVAVMQLTLGTITVGTVNLNFVLIPIIVGGILFGRVSGTIIGAAFGITTFIQCFTGAQAFGALLLGINWFGTFVAIVARGALIGFLAPVIYQGLMKICKDRVIIASAITGILIPVINTSLFIICYAAFFSDHMTQFAGSLGVNVFTLLFVTLTGINALLEIPTTAILVPPIASALLSARKNL